MSSLLHKTRHWSKKSLRQNRDKMKKTKLQSFFSGGFNCAQVPKRVTNYENLYSANRIIPPCTHTLTHTASWQDLPAGVLQNFRLSWVILDCLFLYTVVVGLLYPCLDSHLGEPHKFKREWASVMRCIAVFVGINHASVVSFHQQLASQFHNQWCLSVNRSPISVWKRKVVSEAIDSVLLW